MATLFTLVMCFGLVTVSALTLDHPSLEDFTEPFEDKVILLNFILLLSVTAVIDLLQYRRTPKK